MPQTSPGLAPVTKAEISAGEAARAAPREKTTRATHDAIRANLHRSPLYAGRIQGVGPRYCPSIEDKVVRFSDKERHHVFLEPEGLETAEYYPNGVSTSLPYDIQVRMLRTIPGLERAEMIDNEAQNFLNTVAGGLAAVALRGIFR